MAANQSRTRPPQLADQDLMQLLKALPTTSTTGLLTDNDIPPEMVPTSPIEETAHGGIQPPPPTPARPITAVKSKQMELALSSAMGSMDTILNADRKRQRAQQTQPEPQQVQRDHPELSEQQVQSQALPGESPLNYVAALRLRQEQGRRRTSRDLFDGLER